MPALKPEDCDRLFEYYLNAGDLNHLVMLYEENCSLVRSDGGVGTGHAAVRAQFEPMLATHPRIKLEVVKVVPNGKDLAVVYSDWTLSATRPTGARSSARARPSRWCAVSPTEAGAFAIDDPVGRG
jgi:ketosteroid isomerase-like protein